MTTKQITGLIGGGIVAIIVAMLAFGGIGHNDGTNYQIIQSVTGNLTVRDAPGYYLKNFATVWTYPRVGEFDWQDIRVTFNDGGTAKLDGTLRYRLPQTNEGRMLLYREFGGNEDLTNLTHAIKSHLINTIKVTGPVMSGSEHQSARKGEFYSLAYEQLEDGLYQTRRVERTLIDQLGTDGKPMVVVATEVIEDANGNPVVKQESLFTQYGLELGNFSIRSTEYDTKTQELFSAKKEALLNAQRSIAQRKQESEQRLMVVEKGLREKAEVEAEANKEKARLTIAAELKVDVAEQQKLEAEELRLKAIIMAQQVRDVAALSLETEKLNAEGIIVLASAEEERIMKAGAITEQERVLAEIAALRDAQVAKALSSVKVPGVMFIGGGEGGGGDDVMGNLLNMFLLRQSGLMDINKPVKADVAE